MMVIHSTLLFIFLHSIIQRTAAWSAIQYRGLGESTHRAGFCQLRLSQEDGLTEPSPHVENENLPSPAVTNNDYMLAMGTSPRRIFLSGLTATAIALAGNLFGAKSQLLTLFPEDVVEASRLDTYFPRGKNAKSRLDSECFNDICIFDHIGSYR